MFYKHIRDHRSVPNLVPIYRLQMLNRDSQSVSMDMFLCSSSQYSEEHQAHPKESVKSHSLGVKLTRSRIPSKLGWIEMQLYKSKSPNHLIKLNR